MRAFFALCAWAISCGEPGAGTDIPPDGGPSDYQKIIKEAYDAKSKGDNGQALRLFEQAADLVVAGSEIHASSLDDRASVLMRMGRVKEAERLFAQAIDILEKINGNRMLRQGIESRLTLVEDLRAAGVTCREPARWTDPEKPYFPNVERVQEALGKLGEKLADCAPRPLEQPVTMRITVSGDGHFVNAQAKGTFEGTDVETCIVDRLRKLVPDAGLPAFGACFRGFTCPFMVGRHEPPQAPAPPSSTEAVPDGIPPENAARTDMPPFDAARTGATALLQAYGEGKRDAALPFFFPADAFNLVKDSPDPARYHRKLVGWYLEDVDLESARFKGAQWTLKSLSPGVCRWKKPGAEANRIGYWSCTGNTGVATAPGKPDQKFDIRVMINWGKNWYVTHLRPIRP